MNSLRELMGAIMRLTALDAATSKRARFLHSQFSDDPLERMFAGWLHDDGLHHGLRR